MAMVISAKKLRLPYASRSMSSTLRINQPSIFFKDNFSPSRKNQELGDWMGHDGMRCMAQNEKRYGLDKMKWNNNIR